MSPNFVLVFQEFVVMGHLYFYFSFSNDSKSVRIESWSNFIAIVFNVQVSLRNTESY